MNRECLITAAYLQEVWLWYVVMSSRRRCHGLWNLEAEAQCYGKSKPYLQSTALEEGDVEDGDLEDGDLKLDKEDAQKVAFTLPTTSNRIAHLKSTIRLMRETSFLKSRYLI